MREMITQIGRILQALWNIGNFWAKWTVRILVLWPLTMLMAKIFLPAHLEKIGVPIVALLPLVALVFWAVAWFDHPLIIPIAAKLAGQKIRTLVFKIIGIEFAIGVFLSLVPLPNDLSMLPLLLLVVLAIVFLRLGEIRGLPVGILTIVAIVLAAIFILGGPAKAEERIDGTEKWISLKFEEGSNKLVESSAKQRETAPAAKPLPGTPGYTMECGEGFDGSIVVPQGTTRLEFNLPPGCSTKKVQLPDNMRIIRLHPSGRVKYVCPEEARCSADDYPGKTNQDLPWVALPKQMWIGFENKEDHAILVGVEIEY